MATSGYVSIVSANLIARLSSHMSELKWKQIVGKTIDEKAYVSPDLLRKDYERAIAETCFREVVSEEEVELRVAKRLLVGQLKSAGLEPKKILRTKRWKTTAEEVAALQEALSKKQRARCLSAEGEQIVLSYLFPFFIW